MVRTRRARATIHPSPANLAVATDAGQRLRKPCRNPGHLRYPRLHPACSQAARQGRARAPQSTRRRSANRIAKGPSPGRSATTGMRRFRPFELHGGTAAHGPWDICDYPGGCSPTERARRAPNRTIHGAAMMKLPGTALTCPSSPIRPITCGGKITAAASASPGPGCTPPSGYFLPASDRPFRESLHVANRSHPRQRVVAKYLAFWRHRSRVVQAADMKDHQARPGSRLLGNR